MDKAFFESAGIATEPVSIREFSAGNGIVLERQRGEQPRQYDRFQSGFYAHLRERDAIALRDWLLERYPVEPVFEPRTVKDRDGDFWTEISPDVFECEVSFVGDRSLDEIEREFGIDDAETPEPEAEPLAEWERELLGLSPVRSQEISNGTRVRVKDDGSEHGLRHYLRAPSWVTVTGWLDTSAERFSSYDETYEVQGVSDRGDPLTQSVTRDTIEKFGEYVRRLSETSRVDWQDPTTPTRVLLGADPSVESWREALQGRIFQVPEEETESPSARFQAGDRVKFTGADAGVRTHSRARVLEVAPGVVKVTDDGTNFDGFRFDRKGEVWVLADVLESYPEDRNVRDQGYLSPAPVEERAGLRVGDRVRVLGHEGEVVALPARTPDLVEVKRDDLTYSSACSQEVEGAGTFSVSSVEKITEPYCRLCKTAPCPYGMPVK